MSDTAGEQCRVRFLPEADVTYVPCGTTVAEAAARAGVFITLPCGGRGTCGKCRVRVVEGELAPPTASERELLSAEELEAGVRLACQARITGQVVIEIPVDSRALERKEISLLRSRPFSLAPAVRSHIVQVPAASIEDQRSDLERMRAGLPQELNLPCSATALRNLPRAVRAEEGCVRVVASEEHILDVVAACEAGGVYGAAVDLGTTTVVAYLFDLSDGRYLASAASYNPQARHGSDVISRIQHAMSSAGGLEELAGEARQVVNEVIYAAAEQAGIQARDIYEVVMVGNTCMHHLFLGIPPDHLAQTPYVAAVAEAVQVPAGEVGIEVHPAGGVYWLPAIAGFVGADTVAVILATELVGRPYPALAIDIGTNGEVALWTGERLLVASCAAGPAFEGAQICHGVRARPGAVERVELRDADIAVSTIGDLPAVGICGSGLFDAVAVLLDVGLLDVAGRLQPSDGLPEQIARRIQGEAADKRIVLVDAEQAANGEPIVLTQRDIRQVQLAKGAIRTAVELLLSQAGLSAEDVGEVLLAGAFGNYVNPRSILRIGLLPPQIARERVHGIGNAAGAGAALALLSKQERKEASKLAREAVHIELFTAPEFQDLFAQSMLFE